MARNSLPHKEKERTVLKAITEGGEMTAKEIRERTGLSRNEIQSCVVRMSHSGYIKIVRREKDGNVWGLS